MKNPFIFDRPNTMDVDEFLQYYIKDHTYTRFLESTRNIILIGVRGSGKTSTLMYYSFPVQIKNSQNENKFSVIGIHIPCKNALFNKKEYLLYSKESKKYIVVEHFLCINIITSLCETFLNTYEYLEIDRSVELQIIQNLEFILDCEFCVGDNIFEKLKLYTSRESLNSQKKLNGDDFESFINFSFSFNNTVIPVLEQLRKIDKLKNAHFSLLFDDMQDLSQIHKEIINSWISYRDNKLFSFKIATADIKLFLLTSAGGVILEGHDFIKIDLTKSLYSKDSEFAKFAKEVINNRLKISGINVSVDKFLPISAKFEENLIKGKELASVQAKIKYPNPTGTQVADYVTKYGRAISFRRNAGENLPQYSGIDTIIDISTGVIRNLLSPLYYMFEKEISNSVDQNVKLIRSSTQADIIKKTSEGFWQKLKSIDSEIDNCSTELANAINNLFDNLISYLKKRLKDETISEPRALNFVITNSNEELDEEVKRILEVCLRSTLLYRRLANNKSTGNKQYLYVPNRLLLPTHGLDPHGQYSYFSITASDFLAAAYKNKPIPFFNEDPNESPDQLILDL
ncbi:hypothetical protein ASF10_14685 [Flavobacterium sp. Leaf82]|uniref:ORC-CDC6 family AAA ATPase n=1 Tax=Flavobacterium sp. Leaf82 TaxID=1736238 RepID=UPI0006FD7A9B|nr:hypothetical protein [Flavobacterium sp. Leaf82]KQO20832.1 hypothetical protein ASF10_14685 [Flavobacterium sp. Leaf82]